MKHSRRLNVGTLTWILVGVIGLIAMNLLFGMGLLRRSHEIAIMSILINIILAASLNLILGVAGQFSLGHAGFMAIGAYSVAMTLQYVSGYLGFILAVFIGLVISALVSLIVAIPTLRLKGDYLAIATLGIAEMIRIIIINLGDFTGGAIGISNIPRFPNFTMLYIATGLSLYILSALKNSRFGRVWHGVKEDEIASNAMGIDLTKNKVAAFTIGALFASLSGSLYASYYTIIQPSLFDFNKSVDILVIAVLGGLGSFTGTVLSAITIGLINLFFQSFAQERIIIYSILLIVMMIFKPNGLLGDYELSFKKLLRRRKAHDPTHD